MHRQRKWAPRNGDQAELEMLESPLAGGWGRTSKELRVPVTNQRSRFENRGSRFDLDQDHRGSRDRNGRSRVHDNAQRAMVSIALSGMDVRHLDHGEQRQQDKTHYGDNGPSTWPSVECSAAVSPKSCQKNHPLIEGYTQLDAADHFEVTRVG